MGSRSLLTRVRTTFASATALARTLGVFTSQFPVIHHSDEGSGRPAWPMVRNLHPLHLLILLIPEFCPGGQRLTCGPTLSTN